VELTMAKLRVRGKAMPAPESSKAKLIKAAKKGRRVKRADQ
jgi:hypothetical protein